MDDGHLLASQFLWRDAGRSQFICSIKEIRISIKFQPKKYYINNLLFCATRICKISIVIVDFVHTNIHRLFEIENKKILS